MSTNICANADCETTGVGWYFGDRATSGAISTLQAHDGTSSVRVVKNATAGAGTLFMPGNNVCPVSPSTAYLWDYWAYTTVSNVILRTVVDFYQDTTDTFYISTSTQPSASALVPSQWTRVRPHTFTTPALAGFARPFMQVVSGLADTNVIYYDSLFMGLSDENLYGSSTPPASNTDVASTGVYWSADVDGTCTGGRYYNSATTPHGAGTIKLWTNAGVELASKGFTVESGDGVGWYDVLFDTPISITAATQYVISNSFFTAYYSSTIPWPGQTVSGNLQDHTAKWNSTANVFPTTDVGNKYWIDVLFDAGDIPISSPSVGSWVQVIRQAINRASFW